MYHYLTDQAYKILKQTNHKYDVDNKILILIVEENDNKIIYKYYNGYYLLSFDHNTLLPV